MSGWDILKGVGDLFLESIESQARHASKSGHFSDEQKEYYSNIEKSIRNRRDKDDSDDDY